MKVNKELKEAHDKLQELSNDEHMQRIAEWRYKALLEENTARSSGFKEATKLIAIKLLKEKADIDLICKVTGFTKEDIKRLQKI